MASTESSALNYMRAQGAGGTQAARELARFFLVKKVLQWLRPPTPANLNEQYYRSKIGVRGINTQRPASIMCLQRNHCRQGKTYQIEWHPAVVLALGHSTDSCRCGGVPHPCCLHPLAAGLSCVVDAGPVLSLPAFCCGIQRDAGGLGVGRCPAPEAAQMKQAQLSLVLVGISLFVGATDKQLAAALLDNGACKHQTCNLQEEQVFSKAKQPRHEIQATETITVPCCNSCGCGHTYLSVPASPALSFSTSSTCCSTSTL